ncbi:hypothetical protein, partial [Alteromonas stellipolaris]|uniref:hypothetical protein n=1 Tax=Alteromonas stellipolaris TaxID=233316 RepID=UPI001D8D15FC
LQHMLQPNWMRHMLQLFLTKVQLHLHFQPLFLPTKNEKEELQLYLHFPSPFTSNQTVPYIL